MGINDITGSHTTSLDNVGGGVIHLLAIIGSGLAVIIMIILGIKYMLGSIEEKAGYRKSFIPYLVGAILLFGASSIAELMYNIFK